MSTWLTRDIVVNKFGPQSGFDVKFWLLLFAVLKSLIVRRMSKIAPLLFFHKNSFGIT